MSLGIALAFGMGVAAGVAVSDDTVALDDAHGDLRTARGQILDLGSELAEAQADNTALSGELEEAEARADAARQKGQARDERLDALEARLDKRTKNLDARETALDAQERSVEERADDLAVAAGTSTVAAQGFDRAYAVSKAKDIVEDIRSVDERLGDGIMVSSALSLLSDSYGRLLAAGMPPGIDQAKYHGRLTTLQSFAEQAAEEYDVDPVKGSARYAVVRKQTGALFRQLNAAIGTDFRLP